MISKDLIKKQIGNILKETSFPLGEKYEGKVRDSYKMSDEKMMIITTDRISAFDKVIGTLPFKGQVLNQLAQFWFEKTKNVIQNHVLDVPDPNVMVVKKVKILPIEVVVRGYITGSLWRDYEKGTREIYGMKFEEGMKKDQKFPKPILTPTTKEEKGLHDQPISREEIMNKGIVKKDIWEQVEKIALELFKQGTEWCAKNNLILVDTKYEFGLIDGKVVLADEIHTPDSSRFWYKDTYEELFKDGKNQRILDKEYVRQWLIGHGFMGEGEIPNLSEEVVVEAVSRYINAYETITGQTFEVSSEEINERIRTNLKKSGYL